MNNDLISREALKKEFEKVYPLALNELGGMVNKQIYDIIDNAPTVEPTYVSDMPDDKVKDLQTLAIDYGKGIAVFERKRPQGGFTDLERKVIADSINYLLGAELLEENGYTEEVINALKSVLQKIGTEENHL